MRNQETWDFGNKIGAKMIFYLGMSTLIVGTVAYFISPPPPWSLGIYGFFLVVAAFVGIFWCEQQLSDNFDKNGRRVNSEGKPD
ncbi:SdpI/YhfL family protein [Arenibacter echinorum]|uniref:SdpI/YhfL family protein n=2 Tax=Arenibacter echinorum TaxID=440515 RepID=A0A327RBI2_9FLAO|nr:SdpI/YhfL family protein [Arenibacter echinorum]